MAGIRRNIIWEPVASSALVGIGVAGLLSPNGIRNATFYPVVHEIPPLVLSVIMIALGTARMVVVLWFRQWWVMRMVGGTIGGIVWGQWVVGFILSAPVNGIRPGMMQITAMAVGEILLVFHLARDKSLVERDQWR